MVICLQDVLDVIRCTHKVRQWEMERYPMDFIFRNTWSQIPGPKETEGPFHSIKNSGLESEWNRHFSHFHSEILGVPREVGLKFHSIRPFLLGPSFSEPGNRNSTWLIFKLLNIILVLYQTNDWKILLQRYCSGLASQALVSSEKIWSYHTWNVTITARVNSLLVRKKEVP